MTTAQFPQDLELFAPLDQREVLLHQIMRRRWEKIQDHPPISRAKKVSIITPTNKLVYMKNIFENYQRQLYPNKELIIILNHNQLNLPRWQEQARQYPDIHVYQLDESVSLGQCLNYAVTKSQGDYIGKMDDDDYYGPYYLTDQTFCFSYTDAAVIGKASQFAYFEVNQALISLYCGLGYNYVHHLPGGTHLFKREVFDKVQFQNCSLGEDIGFNQDCVNAGFTLYSAGPFNFLRYRRINKEYHTWRKEDDYFLNQGKLLTMTDQPNSLITL